MGTKSLIDVSVASRLKDKTDFGRYFAKMASRSMFRDWLKKRDGVGDDSIDDHILDRYVRAGIDAAKTALEEFKNANTIKRPERRA
jgi:hypothetical protein